VGHFYSVVLRADMSKETFVFITDINLGLMHWMIGLYVQLRNSCSGNPPVVSDGNSRHSCAVLEVCHMCDYGLISSVEVS
jgi:hypothetical protein